MVMVHKNKCAFLLLFLNQVICMKPSNYLKNLQLSTNWRAQYNPLRGLTIGHVVAMLEQGERGNYARLQWLFRYVEKRNPTLRAVLQRRQASMTRLDWDIRVRGDATVPRSLAARQSAFLREPMNASRICARR